MAYIGSTTLLNSGQTWASSAVNTGLADNITGIIFANPGGTLNIEQSIDGINWDVGRAITVVANAGQGFTEAVVGPFIRLRYVNGAANQTVFRVAARFSSAGSR